jgi:cytochrome c5
LNNTKNNKGGGVGSLFKFKAMVLPLLGAFLFAFNNVDAATTDANTAKNNADSATKKIVDPLIDGYYPEYPKTKVATGAKEKLIKRGEYLAKIGDCIACHTDVKGGTPAFAGGLPINTPFGTFYSPNITPDKETGIGNWTEKDMIRALKKGRNPHGQNYFPVFPYPYFAKLTDDDVRAIHYYLMSIPPVKQKNKSLPFPFNLPGARFSLWGWNILFFFPNDDEFKYNPEKSKEWNRGKYIVKGLGHCSMCHTPLNIFGAPKNRYYLTGGFVDGYWAPNITQYGLRSASRYDVADVFVKGQLISQRGPVAGPMADVNHNSLSYLSEKDRLAIATYLKTVVSEERLGVSPSEKQPTIKRGKQVYVNACIICHQQGVLGAPVIGDSANWYKRVKEQGLRALYRHAINGYNQMPVKGACVTCSDNDVVSAVEYMLNHSLTRSQWIDMKKGKTAKVVDSGKDIYDENCAACHAQGKAGAPKVGDKKVWAPLIRQNMDVLIENTVKGNKGHPRRGGCEHCTTNDLIAAIKYMVSKSKTSGNYSLW